MSGRVCSSDYMNWAKTNSRARFNLAVSGLANLKLKDLDVTLDELEITSETGYGHPPLIAALAARLGVEPATLVTAAGTTFANHLAMATLINPGDEVLIEQPTYEPVLSLARYLGARVKRFQRRFKDYFQIDLASVEREVSSRTRLIVITNLHNPSSAQLTEPTLKHLGEIARSVEGHVLVDEVYLESEFDRRPRTAFHLGSEFVVTSSLTKAFGLSGLRCGWIVAEEDLARRMWRLNDLFASTPVHAGERLSVVALRQLDRLARNADSLLQRNRRLVDEFLDSRNDLEAVRSTAGTTVFPKLLGGGTEEFVKLLRDEYETSVVPGRFFEEPQHFRLGFSCDSATLEGGLERLGKALDKFA